MQSPDDSNAAGEVEYFITRPDRAVDVAHYLRQIAIIRRRHAPWINRLRCENRGLPAKFSSWKH